jgi:ABC-2 type transport system ATP-binding protein
LSNDGNQLTYTLDTRSEHAGITSRLDDLKLTGIAFRELHTAQSSPEDSFVDIGNRSS